MTIPQIFSLVGWNLFGFSLAFAILHTINMVTAGVDFILPTSAMGAVGFLISVPLVLLGLVLGIIGTFGERIQERWYEKNRDL